MTLFELIVAVLVISVPIWTGMIVAKLFGIWVGIAGGVLAEVVVIIVVRFLLRVLNRRARQQRAEWREQFRGVYRVLAYPTDRKSVLKPEAAEIKVGDYGWEAKPIRKNGLVYLQGLNERWFVVWWAGFNRDQIEYVGSKPLSQYDWTETRDILKTSCPFPVQARESKTAMGLPV